MDVSSGNSVYRSALSQRGMTETPTMGRIFKNIFDSTRSITSASPTRPNRDTARQRARSKEPVRVEPDSESSLKVMIMAGCQKSRAYWAS